MEFWVIVYLFVLWTCSHGLNQVLHYPFMILNCLSGTTGLFTFQCLWIWTTAQIGYEYEYETLDHRLMVWTGTDYPYDMNYELMNYEQANHLLNLWSWTYEIWTGLNSRNYELWTWLNTLNTSTYFTYSHVFLTSS